MLRSFFFETLDAIFQITISTAIIELSMIQHLFNLNNNTTMYTKNFVAKQLNSSLDGAVITVSKPNHFRSMLYLTVVLAVL